MHTYINSIHMTSIDKTYIHIFHLLKQILKILKFSKFLLGKIFK